MSEWWTYGLSDFLMFSPGTYWRLVELYNRAAWPAHLLALLAGLAALMLGASGKPAAGRVLAVLMAAAWLSAGWFFVLQRYATINWAAANIAAAFAIQVWILLILGFMNRSDQAPDARWSWVALTGWTMAVTGVAFYPVTGWLAGRPWAQAEMVGLMPDPTALTTLGLLMAAPHFAQRPALQRWIARLIPILVLLAGAATRLTMAT